MSRRNSKRLHVSWLIAAASGGIVAGIGAAGIVQSGVLAGLYWPIIAGSLFSVSVIKRTKAAVIMAVLSGVLLGAWAGANELQQLSQYEQFFGRQVTLSGTVARDVVRGPGGDQRVWLGQVRVDETSMSGQVWISAKSQAEIKRGDSVVVEGMLSEGFGTLSGSMYRSSVVSVERYSTSDVGRQMRDWFSSGIFRALPDLQASLGASYLMGQRSILPEELNERLRILGLTHLVVASGFHLTILVSMARKGLMRFSKYLSTVVSFSVIGMFLLLTGFSTSMIRAAMVAGLSLLAWYYGRNIHPVVLLLFVAGLSALINPAYVWGDAAWYLSFSAFAGVIILAPLLHRYFWGAASEPGPFRQMAVATVSAQITTFPVIAYTFGLYSPLALLSNLVILPLVPLAMVLTFIAGAAGLLVPGVSAAVGLPALAVLSYMTSVTEWLAGTPWAYGEVSLGIIGVGVSYICIVAVIYLLWRKTGYNFRSQPPI
jgi:competence protein ComEC